MGINTQLFTNKLALPIGILGLIASLFYFLYSNFINVEKINIEFNIITNTSIVEIKEDINNLKIVYDDSINFIEENKNISVIIIEIQNSGDKSLKVNDYDTNIPFGIEILDAKLIKRPELVSATDLDYFRDVIDSFDENKIILKKKIIDKNESFQIKLYTINSNDVKPKLSYFGKISNQKDIKFINSKEKHSLSSEEESSLNKLTTILSIALITTLSLLTLSLYKNNNILRKTINVMEKKISNLSTQSNKKNKKN